MDDSQPPELFGVFPPDDVTPKDYKNALDQLELIANTGGVDSSPDKGLTLDIITEARQHLLTVASAIAPTQTDKFEGVDFSNTFYRLERQLDAGTGFYLAADPRIEQITLARTDLHNPGNYKDYLIHLGRQQSTARDYSLLRGNQTINLDKAQTNENYREFLELLKISLRDLLKIADKPEE